MNIDGIPGLTIHEHEGRFAGTVDLPPADLANVSWNGRAMLVITADVGGPLRVTTDKEDTNKAHWTISVVDAAIVRDEGMRQQLERSLHIDAGGVEPHPLDTPAPGMMGVYDEEGAFLGFRHEDDNEIHPPVIVGDARAAVEILPDVAVVPEREALGDNLLDEEYDGDVPTARVVEDEKPLFSTPAQRAATPKTLPPERVERIGGPIVHKDPRLQAFLDDDREGR